MPFRVCLCEQSRVCDNRTVGRLVYHNQQALVQPSHRLCTRQQPYRMVRMMRLCGCWAGISTNSSRFVGSCKDLDKGPSPPPRARRTQMVRKDAFHLRSRGRWEQETDIDSASTTKECEPKSDVAVAMLLRRWHLHPYSVRMQQR